jgi:hypothetical protein
VVENSVIDNSIVQRNSFIAGSVLTNSMVGSYSEVRNYSGELSLGDYNVLAGDLAEMRDKKFEALLGKQAQ